MKPNPSIALAGNPNSGKTTLFNRLTGTNQRVGNWPGVTVEKKIGQSRFNGQRIQVVDLPGTYNLSGDFGEESLDESIAQKYIQENQSDVVVNIIDASSIERGLFLTYQLLAANVPLVIALNMMDVAKSKGLSIDHKALERMLGCPVIPIIASKGEGVQTLITTALKERERHLQSLKDAIYADKPPVKSLSNLDDNHPPHENINKLYQKVDDTCNAVLSKPSTHKKPFSERIDDIVLNRLLAVPLFLLAIYLLFFFAITLGSAFQDFFNNLGGLIFIDTPRLLLPMINTPEWLIALICDGIGGGIQLVLSFIPVIAALFFALSFLEDVGYMTRAAFIVDRFMRSIGLSGKAFIPLIIGFGCNVPSVMAARTLNKEGDRLITSLMAPFMSCGARLTVYTLFVAAFFPVNGHNVLFILYLLGIIVAIFTAFLVRRFIFSNERSSSVLELSPYLLPTPRNLLIHTWHKLKGFALRAGKSIVLVVIALNIISSIGTDGSFGHQDREDSMLSVIGKKITPIFSPMGLDEDNWPATVGIFTGLFAKEVVVGTLNALYSSPPEEQEEFSPVDTLKDSLATIPENLKGAFGSLFDNPLETDLNLKDVAEEQGVNKTTLNAMQGYFTPLSAFCYLLFILLYIPCVATVGVIAKEHGNYWATFSVIWSVSIAYTLAVCVYQIGSFANHPLSSSLWVAGILLWQVALTGFVLYYGKKHAIKQRLIPSVEIH
ncbi:MAG: ferrous iron transport protein B [Cellvibrionales bacterium]|nr:ferrous iron transport protein B [Cellvibrionales bacterium]